MLDRPIAGRLPLFSLITIAQSTDSPLLSLLLDELIYPSDSEKEWIVTGSYGLPGAPRVSIGESTLTSQPNEFLTSAAKNEQH